MYSTALAYSVLLALSAGALADQNASVNHAMNMTFFGNQDCAETVPPSSGTHGLAWDENQFAWGTGEIFKFLSYKLSRATTPDEQLDFSGANNNGSDPYGLGEYCASFIETASPGVGGSTLNANQCYNLTGPASVSIPSFTGSSNVAITDDIHTVCQIVWTPIAVPGASDGFHARMGCVLYSYVHSLFWHVLYQFKTTSAGAGAWRCFEVARSPLMSNL